MRKNCLRPLCVLILLLLPATGLCEGIAECATIAAILSVYPPMTVRKSEGPVGSFRNGGISCRVEGGAHAWIEVGKTWTAERYDISVVCSRRPE